MIRTFKVDSHNIVHQFNLLMFPQTYKFVGILIYGGVTK